MTEKGLIAARRGTRAAAVAIVGVFAFRRLLQRPVELDVACPVCGTSGSPSYPHPYKTWANAGKDDDGTYLRRCRNCGAEVEITRAAGFARRRPLQARLGSREP